MEIFLGLICTALSLTGTCLLHTVLGRIIFLPLTLEESPRLVYPRALQKEHAALLIAIAQKPSIDSARASPKAKAQTCMLSRLLGSL